MKVSEADQKDHSLYYFDGKYKVDLKYSGINIVMVLLFLINNKTYTQKGSMYHKSWDEMRKYRDAILWGAKTVGELLPPQFFQGIESFLDSYKKEFVKAKKVRNIEENAADPIPFAIFILILDWALEFNKIQC